MYIAVTSWCAVRTTAQTYRWLNGQVYALYLSIILYIPIQYNIYKKLIPKL